MAQKESKTKQILSIVFLAGLLIAIGGCSSPPEVSIVIPPDPAVKLKPGDSIPLEVQVMKGKAVKFEWTVTCLQVDDSVCQGALKDPEGIKNFITAPDRVGDQIIVGVVAVDSRGQRSKEATKVIEVVPSTSSPDTLVPISRSTREPPTTTLKPGQTVLLMFTSGLGQEAGRQEISIGTLEPGQYTLILQNASAKYSGHWLIWDYLALESDEEPIWAIGNSNAPPDYSDQAFAEFCHPQQGDVCEVEFTVGHTSVGDFVQELNDGQFPTEKIYFEITDQQANSDLRLVLSTLYSTHDGAEDFQMEISLTKEP